MNRSPRSNIRRLAIGRLISVTGGAAAYTALTFSIWQRLHSPAWQTMTLLLTFGVVGVLSPLTGILGDRFDRRRVMIWSEAVSGAVFGVMALVDDPAWLVGLAFVSALAETPFWTASAAALPNLAEREEDIAWANSLVGLGRNAGIMLGPVIGGVLADVVGLPWVFALNAVSFGVSLALTLTVRGRFRETATGRHHEHEGVLAGLAFVARERVLRRMVVAWLVFLLGMGMGMVADAPLADSFGWKGLGVGLLIGAWGMGSVLGSLAGRWLTERSEYLWLVLGSAGVALASLGVGFAPAFALALASLLVMGTSDGLTMVAEQGIMQRRSPDAVRSRVLAAFEAVLSLGMMAAYVMAAPMLRWVGPQGIYRMGGVAAAGAALVMLPLLRRRSGDATVPALVEASKTAAD